MPKHTLRLPLQCLHPVLLALGLYSAPAWAQHALEQATPWVSMDQLHTLINPSSLPNNAQVEINLVKKDPRIGSDHCPSALFSNPAGNRLWGRTFLKVQCIGTQSANFFVGVDVNIWAPVLVVKKALAMGQTIGQQDVELSTMNIAQLPQGWIADMAHLNNKTATRPLWPGLVLKQEHLKGQALVRSGDTVKVVIKGVGFSIGGSAQAIESAELGKNLKVKTSQGKVLTGKVVEAAMIEVNP